MRRTVQVDGHPLTFQADDARLASEVAEHARLHPKLTLGEFSAWITERGYEARVSLPPHKERTSK